MTVNAGRDQAAKSYRLLRAILNTAVDDELIGRTRAASEAAAPSTPTSGR